MKLRHRAYGSICTWVFAITFLSAVGLATARDIFDPDKSLCRSSHIFVATVVIATDTGCFDKSIKWDDELSHGIACDPNHVGPQLLKVKQILGAVNDNPEWATTQKLATGDRIWVQPDVINYKRLASSADSLEGKLGALDVKPLVDRPLNRAELRRMFYGRDFIFAAWILDPSEYGADPPKLPINTNMYELNQMPWVTETIQARNGKNCPAPVQTPRSHTGHS